MSKPTVIHKWKATNCVGVYTLCGIYYVPKGEKRADQDESKVTCKGCLKRLSTPSQRKQRLLTSLQALQDDKDYERAHCLADELILAYIGDKEVTEAFNKINKY